MLLRIILSICLFYTSHISMAVSEYQRVEIISSDSLRAIMEKANSLDSSIKKDEVLYAYECIRGKSTDVLIKYDSQLKSMIFAENFSITTLNKRKIKKVFRLMPLGFASQYLNYRRIDDAKDHSRLRNSEAIVRTLENAIYQTGEGSWEQPYEMLSFYDAYFFVIFLSGQLPQKGDYFVDESNRLIGAFQYYRRADDTIQIIYFKLNHLKDYYEQGRSFFDIREFD